VILIKKIAKFFYANNVAFNVANSKHFINMITTLRPGYNPPDNTQLSGRLLDDVLEEVELHLKHELSEQTSLTLILDGWTNNNNDSIFACSIHTGTKAHLLRATDCGAEKKTAEFCANIGKACIEEIKEKYGQEIFAICADNENKMNAVSAKLKLLYPHMITYGCSAHVINLCVKDIIPNILLEHVVKVQKHFRNKHNAHGWLTEKHGLMPQIPCDTRWNSQQECLRTFVANFHKYNEIRLEHMQEFDQQISNILTNAGIYAEASNLLKQLKILSEALNNLQSDTANLSDAVQIWLHILNHEILEHYHPQLMKRFQQNIQPFHLLAYITDPSKCFGEQLSAEQEELAEQWLLEMHPKFLPYLLKLKIKDSDIFPAIMFNEDILSKFSAKKWWHVIKQRVMKKTDNHNDNTATAVKEFCEFLMKLHSCPPTSASIERIFSSYGLIWSKLRNRLGAKKAENLVKIYKFFKTDAEADDC